MSILKKIIGIFFVVNSIPAIYILINDDFIKNDKVVFVLMLLIFTFFIYAGVQLIRNKRIFPRRSEESKRNKLKKEKEKQMVKELARQEKEKELNYSEITLNSSYTYKGNRNFENIILANGYTIDKAIKIDSRKTVYVDDTNKVFLVNLGRELHCYNFDKLVDFEVTQNDEVMIKGKSMATLTGGLLFGLGGAIVGSSGKRKQVNSVSNVKFNIYLNDLNNSQITIPLLLGRTKINSYIYNNLSKITDELMSTFKYIEVNKQ